MQLLGKTLAFLAPILVGDKWAMTAEKLASSYAEYRLRLGSRIPAVLATALIAAEDHRFQRHNGVDLIAITRAVWRYVSQGRREGGSTIEQQLVRTLTRQYDRQLKRKLIEILLAIRVQTIIPKEEIPGVYLSVAYFGWRMNGVPEACKRLGIELARITPEQAAGIVARLKYPEPKKATPLRLEQIALRSRHIISLINSQHVCLEVRRDATILDPQMLRTTCRFIPASRHLQ